MAKTIEVKINRFDGGISDNARDSDANTCALVKDYKIDKNFMIAHKVWASWTNNSEKITRFLYGKVANGTDYELYGFGETGAGKGVIYTADVLGAATAWSALKTSTDGTRASNAFISYKDIIYFWQNGDSLSNMTQVGTPTLTDATPTLSVAYTNVAQPIVHPADDICYFFHDNFVSKMNDTTPSSKVLTLPSNLKIVGGAAYSNYLAIACSSIKKGETNSVLFFWDRDGSLETISDKIDLGHGDVVFITSSEDGGLYLGQDVRGNSSLFGDTDSIQIKYFSAGTFLERNLKMSGSGNYLSTIEFNTDTIPNAVEEKGSLYFPVELNTALETDSGVTQLFGIAKVWRRPDGLHWALDRAVTSVSATKGIDGIFNIEGSWFLSHSLSTTLSQSGTATLQAIYETNIFSAETKGQLTSVTLLTTPDANDFVVSYRKDAETTWTPIKTVTSGTDIRHEFKHSETNVDQLPTFHEIQFQITARGATAVKGLNFRYDVMPDTTY